ncbi:OprD family outer membrane porin [Pseudomonas aeruginosa]|nr:OprD family outer membrane porin [Pseudomonas aeruginosa]
MATALRLRLRRPRHSRPDLHDPLRQGRQCRTAGQRGEGREWERNTELQYVFQSGALKNLGIRWRNATFRSNFTRDIDENRLIVSYTPPIW